MIYFKTLFIQKKIFCVIGIILIFAVLITSSVFTVITVLNKENVHQTEQIPIAPEDSVRGVWIASVANINFPSRADLSPAELIDEIEAVISTCKRNNLNTLFFQVRPSCDALYKSEYYPISEWLSTSGVLNDNFDPLAYLICEAHKNGIAVHAWINPLRVTYYSADSYEEAVSYLKSGYYPAENTDSLIYYGGKLYLNPAKDGVVNYITSGIKELCENYPIDGIVFDDYFYPSTTEDYDYGDESDFESVSDKYAAIGDWRRDNINRMIKASYDTVKNCDENILFGVSPTGIWQNSSSDERGSLTRGYEAYSSIYCDALAWIDGGYIDYISPQIYWSFDNENSGFGVLADWWNEQLRYTDVRLIISHAAYKSDEWDSTNEIYRQIKYTENLSSFGGSMLYGYAAITRNDGEIQNQLASVYANSSS